MRQNRYNMCVEALMRKNATASRTMIWSAYIKLNLAYIVSPGYTESIIMSCLN